MIEYLRIIAQGRAPIHLYVPHQRPYTDRSSRYICVRRIPEEILPVGARIVFVNTEQLTVPAKLAEYNAFLRSARTKWPDLEVWDYSLENIRIGNQPGAVYVPVIENALESQKLRGMIQRARMSPQTYDVACVGTPTSYRMRIVKDLQGKGIKIDFIHGSWADERDERIARCKVLLNLHADSTYNLYEPIRCERWRFVGMPIVSEPCVDPVPPGVIVCDIPFLADAINRLLGK